MLNILCVVVILLSASSALPLTTTDVGGVVDLGLRLKTIVADGFHEFMERDRRYWVPPTIAPI
jgi:hypothetical protein